MRELIISNHAIGDREALDQIWAEHGYWFFRDVLDKEALASLRREYVSELCRLDLVNAEADEDPRWNGKPIYDFPATFTTCTSARFGKVSLSTRTSAPSSRRYWPMRSTGVR